MGDIFDIDRADKVVERYGAHVIVSLLERSFPYADHEGAFWTEEGGDYGELDDEELAVLRDLRLLPAPRR